MYKCGIGLPSREWMVIKLHKETNLSLAWHWGWPAFAIMLFSGFAIPPCRCTPPACWSLLSISAGSATLGQGKDSGQSSDCESHICLFQSFSNWHFCGLVHYSKMRIMIGPNSKFYLWVKWIDTCENNLGTLT